MTAQQYLAYPPTALIGTVESTLWLNGRWLLAAGTREREWQTPTVTARDGSPSAAGVIGSPSVPPSTERPYKAGDRNWKESTGRGRECPWQASFMQTLADDKFCIWDFHRAASCHSFVHGYLIIDRILWLHSVHFTIQAEIRKMNQKDSKQRGLRNYRLLFHAFRRWRCEVIALL